MADRTLWQYCQIEVGMNNRAILRQFFPDRDAVEHDLQNNWTAMIGKLGDQGWEMVSAFPNEGGRGKSPLTYVFKRPYIGTSGGGSVQSSSQVAVDTSWQNPPPKSPLSGFDPLG